MGQTHYDSIKPYFLKVFSVHGGMFGASADVNGRGKTNSPLAHAATPKGLGSDLCEEPSRYVCPVGTNRGPGL